MNWKCPSDNMKLKSDYPFGYIVTYIPSYYCNLEEWQVSNQRAVYNFKNGIISEEHKRKILETINSIAKERWEEWAICFIPASNRRKTATRYSTLVNYLTANVRCPVQLDAVDYMFRQEPSYMKGKEYKAGGSVWIVDERNFQNRNVILIDDVITTGSTFREVCSGLKFFGAKRIVRLIFGKTIHPRLPVKKDKSNHQTEET